MHGGMRFSRQDSPSADVQGKHRCRSGPCQRDVEGHHPREPASRGRAEVADDSLKPRPATLTAPFNWVRIPSEKTSLIQAIPNAIATATAQALVTHATTSPMAIPATRTARHVVSRFTVSPP